MADARRRAGIVAIACAIAAPCEGLRLNAYADVGKGVITVCYGHTGSVQLGETRTLGECRALLDADMVRAVDQVQRCAPSAPDNVVAGFSDAVFNMGGTIACDRQRSTAARLLAAGQWRAACEQLPRWSTATVHGVPGVPLPGLVRRRAADRELCLRGLP